MPRPFLILIIFFAAALPAYAGVLINEVAWMGTEKSASDEWIELYSDSGWSLSGWTLVTADGGTKINLKNSSSTGKYYLIERTDDNAVPDITADMFIPFGKGLSNGGEILILKDADGNEIDRVDGSNGWPIGGDSESKQTLQRSKNEPTRWITAVGTPRAENANYIKKAVPIKSVPTAPAREAVKEEGEVLDDFSTFAPESEKNSFNSEYIWLFGGIAGGALLGFTIIFLKRFYS